VRQTHSHSAPRARDQARAVVTRRPCASPAVPLSDLFIGECECGRGACLLNKRGLLAVLAPRERPVGIRAGPARRSGDAPGRREEGESKGRRPPQGADRSHRGHRRSSSRKTPLE
jgi:hypothetical protein